MTHFNFAYRIKNWLNQQAETLRDSKINSSEVPASDLVNLVSLEDRVLYSAAPLPVEMVAEDVDLEMGGFDFQDVDDRFSVVSESISVLQDCDAGCDLERLELVGDQLQDLNDLDPNVSGVIPVERNELVVVDESVEDYQSLVADLLAGGASYDEILFLKAGDGIETLTAALDGRIKYDAVHIVAHLSLIHI